MVFQGTNLELVVMDGVLTCGPCRLAWLVDDGVCCLIEGETSARSLRGRLQAGLPRLREPMLGAGLPLLQHGSGLGALTARVDELLDLPSLAEGASVLEIGARGGARLAAMAETRADLAVWGTDHRPGNIALAREHLRPDVAQAPKARLLMSAPDRLPLPDDQFDRTIEVGGLIGGANGGAVLAEMARVTRSGGRVIAVEPGLDPAASAWQREAFRLYVLGDAPPELAELVPQAAGEVAITQLDSFHRALSFRA